MNHFNTSTWSISRNFTIIIILFAHQHKTACMKIKVSKNKNNDHDGASYGIKCSQEGDRIPPLESNGQSLEQEHRLSCVFRGWSDSTILLLFFILKN